MAALAKHLREPSFTPGHLRLHEIRSTIYDAHEKAFN